MKRVPLDIFCYIDKFEGFDEIKNDLLNLIEAADAGSTGDIYDGYKHNITRLDWDQNHVLEREWVKFFIPYFEHQIKKMFKSEGYSSFALEAIWFQQYKQGSIHNWHIHSANYTGAFYLELPEGTPKTQLYHNSKILDLDVKEGDIAVFPSFTTHRSPKNESDKRKTIISFNFVLKDPKIFYKN